MALAVLVGPLASVAQEVWVGPQVSAQQVAVAVQLASEPQAVRLVSVLWRPALP